MWKIKSIRLPRCGPSETNARLDSSILPAFADSMASRSIFRIAESSHSSVWGQGQIPVAWGAEAEIAGTVGISGTLGMAGTSGIVGTAGTVGATGAVEESLRPRARPTDIQPAEQVQPYTLSGDSTPQFAAVMQDIADYEMGRPTIS